MKKGRGLHRAPFSLRSSGFFGRDEARPSQASDNDWDIFGRDEARPSQAADNVRDIFGRDEARPSQA